MANDSTRRLLLGVTGGIAAYKTAELARLLIRNNVDVRVAMTEASTRFVAPATFQALTRTLAEALALVDIKVLDHFIVAPGASLSFAERGLL